MTNPIPGAAATAPRREPLASEPPRLPGDVQGRTMRQFFSRSEGLCIHMTKGRLIPVGDTHERVDEVLIQFGPHGDGFGVYRTEDPAEVEFLEARYRRIGDVFPPEVYQKLSVPAEVRNEGLERLIQDQNRLIMEMKDELEGRTKARQTKLG